MTAADYAQAFGFLAWAVPTAMLLFVAGLWLVNRR